MRRLLLGLVTGVLLALPSVTLAAPAAPRYQLSLGDDLALGAQPNSAGTVVPTNEGYADQLFATEQKQIPSLMLVKGGCQDVDQTTMTTRSPRAWYLHCVFRGRSELGWAAQWLRAHHAAGEVPIITLDLGIHAVPNCWWDPTGPVASCLSAQATAMATRLPGILKALKAAAPRGTTIAMMTNYDPGLAFSLLPYDGNQLATQSLTAVEATNTAIIRVDKAAGVRTADVATAFHTTITSGWTRFWFKTYPLNVGSVCMWTWSCQPTLAIPPNRYRPAPFQMPPSDPNRNGAAVIAAAFAKAIGPLH